jgi:hypothetical protein
MALLDAEPAAGTGSEVPDRPRAGWLLLGGLLTGVLLAGGSLGLWTVLAGPAPLHTETQQQIYHQPVTDIDIEIDLNNSPLTLVSGPPGKVTVRRQLTWDRAKPLSEDQVVGRALQIRSHCPDAVLRQKCRVGLVLEVPPGTSVRAKVTAGTIRADDLTGAVDLTTVSGDIAVSDLRGRLRARSMNGVITGTDLTGPEVDVKTEWADVDLRFTDVPDVVQAITGTGNVSIAVPPAGTGVDGYQVRADTKDGRQNVDVLEDSAGQHAITAFAEYGNVTVRHSANK